MRNQNSFFFVISLRATLNETSRADPGIFDWGGPNFGSDRTVKLFWGGRD